MSFFLAKILVSAGIVVGVTTAAERLGPRIGGRIAATPQLSVVALIFFTLEQGPRFAAEAAVWGIPGVCATLALYVGYLRGAGAQWTGRHPLAAIAVGAAAGIALFSAATPAISLLPFTPATAMLFAALACGVTHLYVLKLPPTAPLRRVRASMLLLILRVAISAAMVLTVTSVADLLGPRWSGLVAGFPVNSLPVIGILHFHYGMDVVKAVIRAWPIGAFGICLFNYVAALTVEPVGLLGSILIAYGVDLAYLFAVELVVRPRRRS